MDGCWLPRGHKVGLEATVRSRLFAGENWQIYSASDGGACLVAQPALADRWCQCGLLERGLLQDLLAGEMQFVTLGAARGALLEPVDGGRGPQSKMDAIAFAQALRHSRAIVTDASFHDAVYVERYSRLLPVWSLTPPVDDSTVLGSWLSGGVSVSVQSFRRMSQLAGWMDPRDLLDVARAAGIEIEPHFPGCQIALTGNEEPTNPAAMATGAPDAPPRTDPDSGDVARRRFELPGRPQLEAFFNEHVLDIIADSARYEALGIGFPAPVVLHGPPGCGKTFAVEKLVEFLDWPMFSIESGSVASPYIHDTSKKIAEVFDRAIDAAPSVLVIDEMESYLSDRASAGVSGLYHVEEVAEFLRRIPEASSRKVLIIAMTNMIDMIDPAILRRGRFDHVIEVGMPSAIEVASLLDNLIGALPTSEDIDTHILAERLAGRPLSDIAFAVREGARLSARAGRDRLEGEFLRAALLAIPEKKVSGRRGIGFD